MQLYEFINKWQGRYCDFDGAYGFQCVDLMRQYVKDVHGLATYTAIPTVGAAKDIYKNFRTNRYFYKIGNLPNNIPQKGDIMFFGYYPFIFGWAGHVGIVESASLYHVVLFNQNYPTGNPCGLRRFSYKGALGWFRRL